MFCLLSMCSESVVVVVVVAISYVAKRVMSLWPQLVTTKKLFSHCKSAEFEQIPVQNDQPNILEEAPELKYPKSCFNDCQELF